MTIFVGGPLHGQHWTPPQPETGAGTGLMFAVDVAEPPTTPPRLHVDLATGAQYVLVPVSFGAPNPVTGNPEQAWEATAYVHDALAGMAPEASLGLFNDAVMRSWFTSHGKSRHLLPQSTPDSPLRLYAAGCPRCGESEVFETLLERAVWAASHVEQQHTVEYETITKE